MKIILLFIFFALSLNNLFAQNAKIRTFDAQHYIIRSAFDRANKIYFGDVTVQVKPLKDGFDTLILDSVGMKFESITLETDGTKLQAKQIGEQISIPLGKSFSANDVVSVRLKYSTTKPQKGIYFVAEKKDEGKVISPSQVWTQGEPQEARHWFPSYDFPDDKATTEQYLTVPNDEVAISNGELVQIIENANGTKTYHYKMPVVHSVYLTSFIIGKYVKIEAQYKNIPLNYYVYPGREQLAEKAYGKTPDMMRVFEELTGFPYPFNKYDQTEVADFTAGGMENITATTMADSEMAFGLFMKDGPMDLVSHELAHSWFGNMVTTKDWTNLWLNEGFATFMEAIYREKLYGRADYLRKVREDASRAMVEDSYPSTKHPLFRVNAPSDDGVFTSTIYQKGGAVLHTLREEIGDEAFWKGVNIYLNRHKFDSVVTDDLKKAMEEASNKDLNCFFNQWIYKAGFPRLNIKQTYNPSKKKLTLTVTQTQKVDSITPAAFILPLEVEIQSFGNIKTEKIMINKRIQTFTFPLNGKPAKVFFDKNEKIPLKVVKLVK